MEKKSLNVKAQIKIQRIAEIYFGDGDRIDNGKGRFKLEYFP